MDQPTPAPTPAPKKRKIVIRPEKPWPDFPLYWHPRGYWMCKRHGRAWVYNSDHAESYRLYTLDMESLRTTDSPVVKIAKRYLKDSINVYLNRQKDRLAKHEISPGRFARCRRELETELLKTAPSRTPLSAFRCQAPDDRGPSDLFSSISRAAISRGLDAAYMHIVIVRAMFAVAVDEKLMLPPDYRDSFNPPTQSSIDRKRHQRDEEMGKRAWSFSDLKSMLVAAEARGLKGRKAVRQNNAVRTNPHIYAQVLLALYGGCGSDDLGAMMESAIDRENMVVNYNRAKNGRPCMFAITKRVLDAIDHSIKHRVDASGKEFGGLLFRTNAGRRCNIGKEVLDANCVLKRVVRNDTIGKNFIRFTTAAELKKPRTGFKTLRAMCRTMLTISGVDDDIRRVIMGRKFRLAIDEYYLRGDLRGEFAKAAQSIESQLFEAKQTQQIQTPASTA